MSYVKNEWKRGDIVTAEKLNHMEDGIVGGWPADLPKPSVGGYGYTEQGEQTVITWDGDTEGRDSFVLHSTAIDINAYKIAEKDATYPNNATITITIGEEENTGEAELVEFTNCSAYSFQEEPFVIIATAGEEIAIGGMFTGVAPSDGVYFVVFPQGSFTVYATSLTYGTPDTVHKIDEKYLPASGGAMVVVNGTVTNPQTMEIELGDDAVEVLDKINTDFNSGTVYPVVANLTIQAGSRYITQGIVMNQYSISDGEVGLMFQSGGIDVGMFRFDIVRINKMNGEWVAQYSVTSIPIDGDLS